MIVVLAKNADRVVRRGQLLQPVWGLPLEAQTNVLDTGIHSLRRTLASHGAPHVIHTVRGVGFSLRGNSVTHEDGAELRSLGRSGGVFAVMQYSGPRWTDSARLSDRPLVSYRRAIVDPGHTGEEPDSRTRAGSGRGETGPLGR
ncbi:winged helix-turn-helix transcriptional regulator [Rhodococcus opacus]|nr:winged helix-turn-helix transcriptional regulator [Rhodococcus opacus]